MAKRIYYIDSARALASMLGIFYHASLVFSQRSIVSIDPAYFSRGMYEIFCVFTYFRMPFFLIAAGYFTGYALQSTR